MKSKTYDVIVIGAGAGGLNIAMFMNKAGFKTMLIDKSDKDIGGDCLNYGCVPSKALIYVSKLLYHAKKAEKFGFKVSGETDVKKVMKYVHDKVETIRVHENAAYFRKLGIDVKLGHAKFYDEDTIELNDHLYTAKKIVLATGSRPRKLKLPGIEKVEKAKKLYNNENIFRSKELPKNLVVIGGGPIGIEIGQAMQRLGSKVTIVQRGDDFLPKESKDITKVLLNQLKSEGMEICFNCNPLKFTSPTTLQIQHKNGKKKSLKFDAVFVGIGRVLNHENLDLEKAGIELDEKGRKLIVDDYLRTTNKNVFVCGDIAGAYQFTHVAELHAGVILSNFFSPFKKKVNYDNLSWVTYTYPEIATYGLNEQQLTDRKIEYEKLVLDFHDDDRAIVNEYTGGKMVMFVSGNKLFGGSVVAPHAGELFQELVLAKTAELGLKDMFKKIYPYPTAARVNKKIISNYFSKRLTPFAKKVLKWMY